MDYIGIFDDVARALDFDEKAVQQVVSNIDEVRKDLPVQVQKWLGFLPGVDRSVGGYEGLMAQQALPNNDVRDRFAAEYTLLGRIWEALSPDPMLGAYENDYRWLTQVYESVKPPSGNGKLLWHALGAKTVELINENVHVEIRSRRRRYVIMDAQVLEEILGSADPAKNGKELEIKLIARLRRHLGNPKFTALGERLEKIKDRHEQGFLSSLEFLKEVLQLAKEVVEAEKGVDPVEEGDRAKEALTELFNEAKGANTHIIVERIVTDIDDIVKKVRFPECSKPPKGSGSSKRSFAERSSNTSFPQPTRHYSTRHTAIFGNITDGGALSDGYSQFDPVVRRVHKILLSPEIPFRRLHRRVAEQQLNLLQLRTRGPA